MIVRTSCPPIFWTSLRQCLCRYLSDIIEFMEQTVMTVTNCLPDWLHDWLPACLTDFLPALLPYWTLSVKPTSLTRSLLFSLYLSLTLSLRSKQKSQWTMIKNISNKWMTTMTTTTVTTTITIMRPKTSEPLTKDYWNQRHDIQTRRLHAKVQR